jgi:predicted unusual protein kinase regulating ubiquinone biosynthesis (AarF/ABC1/UbiB family)
MNDKPQKPQKGIPTSKIQRATRFVRTGAKIGGNYVKHYAKKVVNPDIDSQELDEANAKDIFDTLSQLKGSALKVAQMLSMQDSLLPKAYTEKFKMAQNSVPPLSLPLIVKTFKKHLDKSPFQIFDEFSKEAVNAASIGQVHEAYLDGKKFAVKIQYPGIAESIHSDLKMVKPFAQQILKVSDEELAIYMQEVENMLIGETNYEQELRYSVEISEASAHLPNLFFPKYYPEFSTSRILTMDWLDGLHLDEFMATNPSQEIRNQIGQALWDFYDYQIHTLLQVHADPHPGNFLFTENGTVGIIDFGCVKVIPREYYDKHFKTLTPNLLADKTKVQALFYELGFLHEGDSEEQIEFFTRIFTNLLEISTRPLTEEEFDFSDKEYFDEMYALGDELAREKEFRNSKKARGSADAIYLNRAYFGLYMLLNNLKAKVKTKVTMRNLNNPD